MPPRRLVALEAPGAAAEVAAFLPRLASALDGSGPGLLLLPREPDGVRTAIRDAAQLAEPLEHDDVALVVPTSGSTGVPRLALLTTAALTASASATADLLGGAGGWAHALPSSYVAGLMVLVRSVLAGAEPVVVELSDGFTPAGFADAVGRLVRRDDDPRYTSLVPTQLARLLDAGGSATAALVTFDAVLLGGAAPPPALLARATDAGVTVVTTYGMTETCGGCVYDGVPLPGTKVAVDPEGRILLAGTTLFSGYRGRPDLTAAALVGGWFRTSDTGSVDDSGRLEVHGRLDDVVVSGGVKVVPAQVEAVLAGHPGVAEVVVVGRPDPEWGEVVVAVVSPAGEPPSLAALRAHARGAVPPGWLPRGLVVVDILPHLPSGKPDRQAVRTLVAAPRS